MRRGQFPLSALPSWCVLNDIVFEDVEVAQIEGRGFGLLAVRNLVCDDDRVEAPTVLTIPEDLVLSAEGVERYAKENPCFRELLDVVGRKSVRNDALIFLLMQLVLSSPDYAGGLGGPTAWTQYLKLLPSEVPVPTMWSEPELDLLSGTSLQSAVAAKFSFLNNEFEDVREKAAEIPFWHELLNIDESITVDDWILLDALYRSRSLELPKSGESMVPCLDLINHSNSATAYFEENGENGVILLLSKGSQVSSGKEVTINYGEKKSAAEMLFSYGFIDSGSTSKSIVLPLEPLDDDPLAKAKLHAFGGPPTLRIREDENGMSHWSAPFVYLMCLNEEDGLQFKILLETDGTRHLKMFWQESDITGMPNSIQELTMSHDLKQVFKLRVITVLLDTIQKQLKKLSAQSQADNLSSSIRPEIANAASQLRAVEYEVFTNTLQDLDNQRTQLLRDDTVLSYLDSMGAMQNNDVYVEDVDNGDDDDFS